MNYWCLGKELELLDELMFEREDSREEVKVCVCGQVVTMMGPVRQPPHFSLGNLNTNKHHEPGTNSSQIIIILGGRKIMVKQNKMLKCSIIGN